MKPPAFIYRIANWDRFYETHDTRKLVRLSWTPFPNKHDGLGFRMIAAEKDAPDLFAAWILMVQLASKSDRSSRGVLSRDGAPLDAAAMAMMTGFPEKIFTRAQSFFSQARMGWLIVEQLQADLPLSPDNPPESPGAPGFPPGRMEEKEGKPDRAAALTDDEWIKNLSTDPAYQGIAVEVEVAKCRRWCETNRRGMSRRRLVNWLNRCEKPMAGGKPADGTVPWQRPSHEIDHSKGF